MNLDQWARENFSGYCKKWWLTALYSLSNVVLCAEHKSSEFFSNEHVVERLIALVQYKRRYFAMADFEAQSTLRRKNAAFIDRIREVTWLIVPSLFS